ncbi:hypothetical protein GobsT_52900 [Gemmata obscuriglobus]|uniref:Uncharacterized protein n=1 Tax=Gemmata obscuriglobus TaxID=114 RepID=A0A2Z3H5F2_9BACT|nr:hypothetical protein [Gemmata obscuriglobus]AWM36844.1 hypothetical protein C1280_07315 [Gemmata obscuriglobus]QEG30485.1 hypothetical protein GobsT_52900 [Gemmata obscuriglobus]VTS09809.1 unnamed protein product [Gemmata obscuriglobus UQM 2246]
MGKFADFYVVPPAEAGAAARSMGGSERWPHYHINRVDVFQVATLYDLLRGVAGESTWQQFEQQVEADSADEESAELVDDEDGGLLFLVSTFPPDFVERLAEMSVADRSSIAAQWQAHPEFFWSRNAEVAAEVVGELCRLAVLARQRQEVVILAESGE